MYISDSFRRMLTQALATIGVIATAVITTLTVTTLTVDTQTVTTSTVTTQTVTDQTISDDLTVSGQINSTSSERILTQALTFSASTQTLAIVDLPASAQWLTDFTCQVATTTATGGLVHMTASMGTGYATGTTMGTDLFYDNTFNLASVANTTPYLTVTSTLLGVASSTAGTLPGDNGNPLLTPILYGPVYRPTNKIVIVKQGYNTSTATGYCRLKYMSGSQVGN